MSKILYIVDDNKKSNYNYDICEDTIIYHFSINSSSNVTINLIKEDVAIYYYYNDINYDDNCFSIKVCHLASNTHSELFNHGVNVGNDNLTFDVEGIVPKNSYKCICNQENQIINMTDGKSSIFPKLIIDNFDVDSNHSAYIGKFKEDVLFYLMSRGISRQCAYRLLLRGFLINIDSIELSKIKDFILEVDSI